MLQERVAAAAHYRVVTVGTQCFVSRLESTEADWRVLADDLQVWRRCSPTDLPDRLQDQASTIAREMGLGFTSQDWVLDSQGDAISLELNPNGQWLFVDDQHHGEITRAIVAWLIAPT